MAADVLIVGAGSAGSILAERLSVDSGCRVTVLEAGPGLQDPAVLALTDDALVLPIGEGSPVVRRYHTRLTETPAHTTEIVRGACIGGSGAVNGCYFWPAPVPDLAGLPGWSQAEVDRHHRAVQERISARPVDGFGTLTAGFTAAAGAAGYARGIAAVPLNMAGGHRRGPGAVFLEPALDRPNLTVLTGIRATRVRFDGTRAVGVDVVGPDGEGRIDAGRVVLSAGAVESAHLLMLSGIGPAADLRALGISVRVDLPVGQHCQDHPEWLIPTDRPAGPPGPVLEAVLVDGSLEIRPYTTGFGSATAPVAVALMHPRSRGRVSLAGADPAVAPLIEHRYDSEPADVADLERGCALVRDILRGSTELGEPVWSTSQHLCGTAPMGPGGAGVVDPRCRVRGVENLWVIDGSVLPAIPGRGPHATIAMLAHRAAEFLT